MAVDTVVLAFTEGRLQTYLLKIGRGPARGKWAFPGGLVRAGETLDDAARRELRAAGVGPGIHLEQLFTFGDPRRDPRAHVVSVAYLGLLADQGEVSPPAGKYVDGRWFSVAALPTLGYDHSLMARRAVGRLRAKLGYTNIACNLLPGTFTFSELETLYAAVLRRRLDRRNFRRRILAMNILRRTAAMRRGAHRPACLYRFAQRTAQIAEIL